MTRDASGVGRWREGGSSRRPARTGPTSASKWLGAAVVSTLLAAAVGVVGWLAFQLWFATGPRPYFVAFCVGPFDKPGIPPTAWLDADRRSLIDDQVFPNADARTEAADKPTWEVMRKRLENLAARPPDESVVVYLSAYAIVDHDKRIQIMAADSSPYEAKTQLALSWVLDRLKNCPAKNKLLVLDIMRGMIDPRDVGGTADGVGELIAQGLQDSADPNRLNDPDLMVIAACGPGQVAVSSETLRHSVFGYYFHRALTTEEADSDGDGAVSVRELAGYLSRNVDAWAMHFRGVHQSPLLLGRQQGDFALAAIRVPRSPVAPSKAETTDQAKGAETSESKAKELAGEDKDKTTAKVASTDTDKSKPAAGKESAYPAWLAEAWTIVERWRKSGDFQAAPRVYRRLARESTRAELRWRGGEPADLIQPELEKTVRELTEVMEQARNIPHPTPFRSVGQARDFGQQPDPALKDTLTALLRLRQKLPDNSPDLDKAVKESLAKLKDKTGLELAQALVDAAEDEILDAKTLAFLDGIVEQSRTPRDVVELQFLHQLASRAQAPGQWNPDTARKAWRTVLEAEQANSRPEAFAWVRSQLDAADASLHEARVLLLPNAANYASWKQIEKSWSDAQEKYRLVGDRQGEIRDGQTALFRALATLVSLIPYLEASPTAELHTDWLDAADQSGQLALKLQPPDSQAADEGGSAVLAGATQRLEGLSRKLLAPFQHAAAQAIAERCRSEDPPDPELALRIDAMLLTPFLAVDDRRALYDAGRALDVRLEKTWNPSKSDGSSGAVRSVQTGARARRRFERMAALLKLAGDATTYRLLDEFRRTIEQASHHKQSSGTDQPWDMSDPASVWSSMARCAELTYAGFDRLLQSDDRGDDLDRPGWLAPAYAARFGDWSSNPTHRSRERASRATWTWLADHYRHESRDLPALIDPEGMLELAARECPADNLSGTETALRIDVQASTIALSPRRPTARATLQLVLTGAGAGKPRKVRLDVLDPEDPRLQVSPPEPDAPEVSATASPTVSFGLTLSDDPARAQILPPAGLIVRAHTPDGRTYHALVPLSIISTGMVPALAISRSPAQCDDLPMDPVRLRPINGLRQRFYVFVKNPSDRAWDVIVEILEGDKVVGSSGAKLMTIAAHASKVVPGFGTPAPKPDVVLHELAGPLRIRLSDSARTVLDEQPLGVAIAAPADYLEVTRAEFAPDAPGQPNRLTVVLRALPALAGPPCRIELGLPMDKDLFPALRELPKAGKFIGELAPDTPELTLYAERLTLDPNNDAEGSFYLNVDGVRRALWFRSRFPQIGSPQRAAELHRPRVSFVAHPRVEPDKPAQLEVAFRVDDAPAGARLEVHLDELRAGQMAKGLTWPGPAKRRHLGFDPGGDEGALLFEASIEDPVWIKPVPGMVGPRHLLARLLDERRKELSSFETDLVLDDQLPRTTSVEVPDRITRGKGLVVRASAAPPSSKIKDVTLIFGTEAEFAKAVADNRSFKARTADPEGRDWSATLPVPKDAPAKLVVTARFTTGVGLTAFRQSAEVAVIDPPGPEEMKPAAPKRGAIVGTVQEGGRPQPGLKVYLLDPMAPANKNILATRDTDEKGMVSFKDLEPKAYRIYCVKFDGVSNRTADKSVSLEPGQTLNLELELELGR